MKSRLLAGPAAIVSTFAAIALAGTMLVRSPQVRAQSGTNPGSDAARIQQGFAIAPVPLNLAGKDPALVGLGSYIVNAQVDCNGCHTLNNGVEFTPIGNPYLLSPPSGPFLGKTTVDPSHYLAGGNDFGPFPGGPGSIEHLYARNLTPDKTGRPEEVIRLRTLYRSCGTAMTSITFTQAAGNPECLPTACLLPLTVLFCK